jgi:hypothetical protein
MLLDEGPSIDDGGSPTGDRATRVDWRDVDRALRGIARRRCKLDAEEARWLREAERLEIWRPLGMVSALDYLERVLGHTPHVANERLRVARALGGEHGTRLTQACEHFGTQLEANHVRADLGIGGISGLGTAPTARDELLDLAHVLANRGGAPGGLGLGCCDAGELADGRELELAVRERGGQHRQLAERARDS